MIEVEYDLEHAHLHESTDALERFFDLLPIENAASLLSHPMPYTPCIHAQKLGSAPRNAMAVSQRRNETADRHDERPHG
jgi:hypothetical protein